LSTRLKIGARVRSESGFSLVEVVLFVSLLVTVLYGSSGVLFHGHKQSIEDRHRWDAAEIGSIVLEELSFSYTSSGVLDDGLHSRFYDQKFILVPEAQHFYKVEWSVTENDPIQGVLNIKLDVFWREGTLEKIVHYQTYR